MNFDDVANTWDTERRIKRSQKICDFILSNINLNKNGILLDYGCGTGLISQNMINHVSKIIGYDPSDKMLYIFDSKFSRFKNRVMSIRNLSQLDCKVDHVISSMVFHHIVDVDEVLSQLLSVMNEQGDLIIIDLDSEDGSFHSDEIGFNGHDGFDREMFANKLKMNGFEPVRIGTVLNDIKYQNGNPVPYSLFYVHARKSK